MMLGKVSKLKQGHLTIRLENFYLYSIECLFSK